MPSIEVRGHVRDVRLGAFDVTVERRRDGVLLVHPQGELGPYPAKVSAWLEHWARVTPDHIFLAQRGADGAWRTLTYASVLAAVRRIGAALLARNLSAERPVAILSGNDIEHALIGLAAMYVGVAYAPISPAYSLMSADFGKLRAIIGLLTPGLVFVNDGTPFARAVGAAVAGDVEVVVARNPLPSRSSTQFSALSAEPSQAFDLAHSAVGPDTIAKFLFTSGSTGSPKAVINTQRMLCANQAMMSAAFRFLEDEPPTVVDWLPWSHTFGGNHNFFMVLCHGGTLYIDDGNPTPAGLAKTVRNLREIAPTIYFNVPKGYDALLAHLRADRQLRETFFSRLKVLFYAGASLSRPTWDALQQLSQDTCGERVIFLSSLGSTETAPLALACTRDFDRPGNIGVPAPGVKLKLLPKDGKLEARVLGPNIAPGYWRQAEQTRAAFDEEGFFRLGDALKFVDPQRPELGLLFDGRIAEDFKLTTGTWVSVGPLRARMIEHFAPYVRDVVIAGADRDYVTALVFPELEACRKLSDGAVDAPHAVLCADTRVRAKFATLLKEFAVDGAGSSMRVQRLLLLAEPPSLDAGEMTDKGSINQAAVLNYRSGLVAEMYREPPSDLVTGVNDAAPARTRMLAKLIAPWGRGRRASRRPEY
ncbi:MAG: feruloyl-CoA synthase [Hyphomicrobiaceae bacterium]